MTEVQILYCLFCF